MGVASQTTGVNVNLLAAAGALNPKHWSGIGR
jgi:hypothetical protein